MASTCNKNTCGNYAQQQRVLGHAFAYASYPYGPTGRAATTRIPTFGITPSHMPMNTLCNNPVEVESALFGIDSTNLVAPRPPVVADLHTVGEVSFINKPRLIMPPRMVAEPPQRPFPVPN